MTAFNGHHSPFTLYPNAKRNQIKKEENLRKNRTYKCRAQEKHQLQLSKVLWVFEKRILFFPNRIQCNGQFRYYSWKTYTIRPFNNSPSVSSHQITSVLIEMCQTSAISCTAIYRTTSLLYSQLPHFFFHRNVIFKVGRTKMEYWFLCIRLFADSNRLRMLQVTG